MRQLSLKFAKISRITTAINTTERIGYTMASTLSGVAADVEPIMNNDNNNIATQSFSATLKLHAMLASNQYSP